MTTKARARTLPHRAGRRALGSLRTAWRRGAQRLRHGGRLPPVCTSARDRALDEGWPLVDLAPEREVVRHPPRTIAGETPSASAEPLRSPLPARSLVTIPGARLVGTNGLVVLPDGAYLVESAAQRNGVEHYTDYLGPPRRPVRELDGDWCSLLARWPGNPWHWFHDALTRLHDVVDRLPPGTHFAVPEGVTDAGREALAALGVPTARTACFTGAEVWQVERLHFTTAPGRFTNQHDPVAEHWLADRLRAAAGVTPTRERRLLVSRADAVDRRLLDHDAVADALAPLGFESVVPGALDLAGQVRTFAAAEVVVGVHGAGLVNAMFAAPGAVVVEILDPVRPWNQQLYWSLADACGLDYWSVTGRAVERPDGRYDITVDPTAVRATVDAALAPRRP